MDIAPPLPAVPWSEMAAHRAYLVGFARRRLHDTALAEDAVHDVFEAVLSGRAVFGGRAALRTWLTAVLKHKIVDRVRREAGLRSLDVESGEDDGGPLSAACSVACERPGPQEIAEQRELLEHALVRIAALPEGLRDALRLRVIDEDSTASVCRTLGISAENLFVRVHRARARLLC